ncbi:unnamed protein product, partial [marine sediment metagenome]
SPLVIHWLELEDPFSFDHEPISKVLDEFSDAVLDGLIIAKSRNTIIMLELKVEPVLLEKGISIRPINTNELWELGNTDGSTIRHLTPQVGSLPFLGEHWNILDIEIKHKRERIHPPKFLESVHRAILTALALASEPPSSIKTFLFSIDSYLGDMSAHSTQVGWCQ